jgi:formylglycine-generating enzyme required for sulfatase activity
MARSSFASGRVVCAVGLLAVLTSIGLADEFGTDENRFTMEFVGISGATNPEGEVGYVADDFRMGKYEVTEDQWNKYTGGQAGTAGSNKPMTSVSWYQAAAFANWLNGEKGKQIAYDLTEDLDGVTDWDIDGQSHLRHPDAWYFLPNENEWVKAGYWNGSEVQTYANKAAEDLEDGKPKKGDAESETGWNYSNFVGDAIWEIGTGSEELNGTYDMMGNVAELTQAPRLFNEATYRVVGGGSVYSPVVDLKADKFGDLMLNPANSGSGTVGFRVASVPEPGSMLLMAMGGIALLRRRRRR